MNISIYTTSDFPYGGAPENFVRQMALGLNECGENINITRVRGISLPYKNDTLIPCSNLLFKKRVTNEFIKFVELLSIIAFLPFNIIYKKIKFHTKIILLYGLDYSYYNWPVIVASKLLGIKVYRIITDYYDMDTIVPNWWKRPKAYFYKQQIKNVDKHFDGLIVLSKYLRDNAINNFVKLSKIFLVPHFIDMRPIINENRCKDNRCKKIIGFCGTPNISNGIIDLVEAFILIKNTNKYNNLELVIIGQLKEETIIELKELFGNSFNDSIFVTGFLNKSEVEEILNQCDILVNPRKSGRKAEAGFPTKLGEYFATKKPVVSTKVGDLKSYFEDRKELIFAEPNCPKSLMESIIFLLDNAEIAREIGENGYFWALKELDYINNAKKLKEFLCVNKS